MAKILVIDDETSILKFCHTLLTASSHQVLTAATLQQGLFLAGAEKPDLILADLNMPGESGLSGPQTILEKHPNAPLVVFSGYITPEIEKSAFKIGIKDVLTKSMSNAELIGRISKLLQTQAGKKSPAAEIKPPSPAAPKAAAPASHTDKILVVDDDASIRSLLAEFLRSKNFHVLEAANGAQAIEIVKNEKPALMLLDVSMPGLSGIETLRKIREFNKEIGVVMATANEDENTAKEAAELGSYQYVLKPFDMKYLELVVLTRLFMA